MGSATVAWAKRHPLATYFLGAYAITWVLVSPLVLSSLGIISTPVPAAWHAFGALGPILSAFGVTALVGGRQAIAGLLRSMGRWRVGWVWGLVAVLSPLGMLVASAALLRLVGQPWPDVGAILSKFGDSAWIFTWFLGSAVYGIGEEPGWRGFALPRLQRRWSPLVASLLLGVVWAGWHSMFFFYRFQFGIGNAIGFFLGIVAGSIILACLYNATGGSVLATMAWHTTWNIVNVIALLVSTALVSLLSAEVMIAAVVIVVVWKAGRRSPRNRQMLAQAQLVSVERGEQILAR